MTLVKSPLFGGIEAGGTKFVCALAADPADILEHAVFPTKDPQSTLTDVTNFLRDAAARYGKLCGLGVGAFGPVDIHPESKRYGHILETAKPHWTGCDILGILQDQLNVKALIDTDVNCALLGESRYGAGRGLSNLVYMTIGTGIGAGIMIDGRIVYGSSHPEIGHMFIPKDIRDHGFSGNCRFHGDQCAEGLVSGPAIKKRFGVAASELAEDHPGWDLIADYISVVCCNILLTVAPDRIILGGGVMQQDHLYPRVREAVLRRLNGYVAVGSKLAKDQVFIDAPGLGDQSGIKGALALALRISSQSRAKTA